MRFLFGLLLLAPGWSQPTLTTLAQLKQHQGQNVKVQGIYRSLPLQASTGPSGIPGFRPSANSFGRAQIELRDGRLNLNPPFEKTSLRSPEEREDLADRPVVVRGRLEADSIKMEELKPQDSLAEALPEVKAWKFLNQSQPDPDSPWDLSRSYAVSTSGQELELQLNRWRGSSHIGGIEIRRLTPGTPRALLQSLARVALGAQTHQLEMLEKIDLDESAQHQLEGMLLEVKTDAIKLWNLSPRESCELEPRQTHLQAP